MSGRYLIIMGSEIRLKFLFLLYCKNKASFRNWHLVSSIAYAMFLGLLVFSGRKTSIWETTGCIYQIWTELLQDLYAGSFSFYKNWSWPHIFHVNSDSAVVNLVPLFYVMGSFTLLYMLQIFFLACAGSLWPPGEFGIVSRVYVMVNS